MPLTDLQDFRIHVSLWTCLSAPTVEHINAARQYVEHFVKRCIFTARSCEPLAQPPCWMTHLTGCPQLPIHIFTATL